MNNLRDNRLHKLLGLLIKDDPLSKSITKYDWKYEELARALKGSTIYEISELCKTLEKEGIIISYSKEIPPLPEYDINLQNLLAAREAYYSGKFEEKRNWGNIINIGLGLLNIILLGYSALKPDPSNENLKALTTAVENQAKDLNKSHVTVDSLKRVNILTQEKLEKLTKDILDGKK